MPITQKDLRTLTENLTRIISADTKRQLAFQKLELQSALDEKFETHRRTIVNEIQNFQDVIISEVKSIKQEQLSILVTD